MILDLIFSKNYSTQLNSSQLLEKYLIQNWRKKPLENSRLNFKPHFPNISSFYGTIKSKQLLKVSFTHRTDKTFICRQICYGVSPWSVLAEIIHSKLRLPFIKVASIRGWSRIYSESSNVYRWQTGEKKVSFKILLFMGYLAGIAIG